VTAGDCEGVGKVGTGYFCSPKSCLSPDNNCNYQPPIQWNILRVSTSDGPQGEKSWE